MRYFALVVLAACGTTDPATPPQTGEVAPFGMAVGDPVTVTITSGGGTATSGDGVLSIAFPPGAVSAPTDITIQPVTNTSFSPARDLAYELSPNDVEFAQPLTLTFTARADFTPSGASELVWVSAQDDAGYWHGKTLSTFDVATGTVSLAVTSFGVTAPVGAATARVVPGDAKRTTPWTADFPYRLAPQHSNVPAKTGFVRIYETQCIGKDNNSQPLAEDELLATCKPVGPNNSIAVSRWTLFTDSLALDGKIAPSSDGVSAVYYAPVMVPPRTVEVWAWFPYAHVNNILKAYVDVDCPYATGTCTPPEWNGTSHVTQGDGSVIDTTWTFELDPTSPNQDTYLVKAGSGVVTVTQAPTPPQGCTLTMDTSHTIDPREGQMVLTTTPSSDPSQPPTVTLRGGGTTVWLATYTTHCPNGDGTAQLPYQAEWWPPGVAGDPEEPVTNGTMASFDMDNGIASGHVTLTKVMPGA